MAAIRAAQLGGKVAVVEKAELGGTCLNRGCIPTKAMIQSANLWGSLEKAADFGINVGAKEFSHKKMMERSGKVVGKLRDGLTYLFKQHKIDLIRGSGEIAARGKVRVTDGEAKQDLACDKIIIATGSQPLELTGMPFGDNILSSTTILQLEETPPSLIVVGAGAMGSLFGGKLSAVTEVKLLDPWAEHMAAMQRDGLRIVELDGRETTITVTATEMDNPVALCIESCTTPLIDNSLTVPTTRARLRYTECLKVSVGYLCPASKGGRGRFRHYQEDACLR